jgi:hypothetical protein
MRALQTQLVKRSDLFPKFRMPNVNTPPFGRGWGEA